MYYLVPRNCECQVYPFLTKYDPNQTASACETGMNFTFHLDVVGPKAARTFCALPPTPFHFTIMLIG